MWNDIETSEDYLHFSAISQTVADLIDESGTSPISIGVSGSWGSGKSSMVKMVGQALKQREDGSKKYIFLEFNAWLYQGYDDAKIALLQAVSKKISDEMKARNVKEEDDAWKKFKGFAKRINWFQASKLVLPLFAGFIPGVNALGAAGGFLTAVSGALDNQDKIAENSATINAALDKLDPELKELIKEESKKPATEQIEELRREFKELLEKLDVKLVVLVDDLDRCLPETAISTLEAMRLLLFVDSTAFIIAADEEMIRNGVKAHFGDVELSEGLVTSYFDKLIQVPIRVPHLGIAEIKVYIVLLYLEAEIRKGNINKDVMQVAQDGMRKLLRMAWKDGVKKDAMEEIFGENPKQSIIEAISMADQLAGILVTADNIKGNPRLIKRFLNALEIRKKVAAINEITVDPGQLIKMLLFERCSSVGAFDYLSQQVLKTQDGKPVFIQEIEKDLADGKDYVSPDPTWNSDFIKNWVLLAPTLGDVDLRPLLYLSRDKALTFAVYDELSPEGKDILGALNLLKTATVNRGLVDRIKKLGEPEATLLLNHVSSIGRGNQWELGTLCAAIHITEAFSSLGNRVAASLNEISVKNLKASIIPMLKEREWANDLLIGWKDNSETPVSVKNAITK